MIVPTRESAVRVGERVAIGPDVKLLTVTHDIGETARRAGTPRSAPIVVGDGAWIGAGAMILAGVTIGRGAVVAGGALVTKDVAPDCLVAGHPAQVLRWL